MSSDTFPEVQQGLSSIELLTKTLALWLRNIKSYVIIAGIPLAMFVVLQAIVGYSMYGSLDTTLFASDIGALLTKILNGILFPEINDSNYSVILGVSAVFVFLGLVVAAFVAGSIVKFALDDLTKGAPSVEYSISSGFSNLAAMLVIQLLIGVIWGICLSPGQTMMVYGVYTEDYQIMINGLSLYIVFGIIAIILLTRIITSPVFIVAFRQNPTESIHSSFALTRGKVVHIVVGWTLLLVVLFIIDFTISSFLSVVGSVIGAETASLIVTILTNLLLGPVMYVFLTLVYADLVTRPDNTRDG